MFFRGCRNCFRRQKVVLANGPAQTAPQLSCVLRHHPPVVCLSFGIERFSDTPCMRRVYLQIPGHALLENGLQRRIGVGTLVNSQQRRALAVR